MELVCCPKWGYRGARLRKDKMTKLAKFILANKRLNRQKFKTTAINAKRVTMAPDTQEDQPPWSSLQLVIEESDHIMSGFHPILIPALMRR